MRGTYSDSTSYTVQTYIEVGTLDEATEIAQLWVQENAGEASVYRKQGRPPWLRIERIARYGSR